jgi:hypothetical protein
MKIPKNENVVVYLTTDDKLKLLRDNVLIKDVSDGLDKIELTHVSTCAHCGHITKDNVTIYRPNYDEYEGRKTQWCVIWCGAVDFEGNKQDMLKRYPEFKGIAIGL